ncbi:hypothetical protein [Eubacterium barkeri]|uniref:Uncharacterized protein n=1 Tax=Eubacterium barkeri TaxID=1528 RepID=A0A1H3IRZ5_EUBBA|nr:hypothetical protein [Eubacterium barkeri]SDY29634.1 hypothetical protein SAMN04488579_12432 [Eubacterium barkeri]
MKYRIEYISGGHSTIEANSDMEAKRTAMRKSWKDDLSDINAIYRMSDNGWIAAELDLVAADFAMEVE